MQLADLGLDQRVPDSDLADHQLVDGAPFVLVRDEVQPGGGVGLGVGVYDEYLPLQDGERCGKIDGGGGFPYAAFLVRDGDDFSHMDGISLIKQI